MIRSGENLVDGVVVEVRRKRIRRINLRIAEDGRVLLSIPLWWATLREGEEFLRSKWKWILKVRSELAASGRNVRPPPGDTEIAELERLIGELTGHWAGRFGEKDVEWRIRPMKTLWGSCNFRRRRITYSRSLYGIPRELVEYVVVHELTHLQVHDHGPRFRAFMDARLPGWRDLRRKLNGARFASSPSSPAAPGTAPCVYRQSYFAFG